MKTCTLLLLSTLTLGLGCDTREEPPPPSAECLVAEFVPAAPAPALDEALLAEILEPYEARVAVSTLGPYGLERYTMTFAASQVTYVWWTDAQAQDEALEAFCGP